MEATKIPEDVTPARCRSRIRFWRGMALDPEWKQTAAERIEVWQQRLEGLTGERLPEDRVL